MNKSVIFIPYSEEITNQRKLFSEQQTVERGSAKIFRMDYKNNEIKKILFLCNFVHAFRADKLFVYMFFVELRAEK
jgi:hypothetical protein